MPLLRCKATYAKELESSGVAVTMRFTEKHQDAAMEFANARLKGLLVQDEELHIELSVLFLLQPILKEFGDIPIDFSSDAIATFRVLPSEAVHFKLLYGEDYEIGVPP